MKDKNLFELGKLAQQGNDMAMLEIIERHLVICQDKFKK